MRNPKLSYAPWTEDEVKSLNAFQESGFVHPFTCNKESGFKHDLTATRDGWVCNECGTMVQQDWAHTWMADWSWQKFRPFLAKE